MEHKINIPLPVGLNIQAGDTVLLQFTKEKDTPLLPAPTPNEPWDRNRFHLTLPVNERDEFTGKAAQIEPSDFINHQSNYFTLKDGKFIFTCPDGGATTSVKTKFARCEARHRTDFKVEQSSEMTLVMSVDKLPSKGIIMQIHGGSLNDSDKPWFKVTSELLKDGTLSIFARCRLANGKEVNVILGAVKLGEKFTLNAAYNASLKTLSFKFNDSPQKMLNNIYTSVNYYWKCGVYLQDTSRIGKSMVVSHYTNCVMPK